MPYVHLVVLLAVAQYFAFGILVGRARVRYGVRAPATSGHEMFERALRVQMNTLEQLIAFLPCLLVAAAYWPAPWLAALGGVYLVGRLIYWRAYMAEPRRRQLGFILTVTPTFVLFALGLLGVLGLAGAMLR